MNAKWPVSPFEQSLLDFEQLLKIQITLQDSGGIFHDPEGAPLLGIKRQSHRRFILCRDGFCERCLQHCKGSVIERAVREKAPFDHVCWKGLREIVVPVKTYDGVLLAVLFGGFWRAGRGLRAWNTGGHKLAASALKNLPPWDKQHAARLCNVLHMLARGFIAELDHLHNLNKKPATRKAVILRFLRYNATQPIGLNELARALALSKSRTSHLVKNIFGSSFQTLLTRERMTRAKLLLVYTDYSVKEIAQRVGMPNEYYFNRTFRKIIGTPPGKFRHNRTNCKNLEVGSYFMEIC